MIPYCKLFGGKKRPTQVQNKKCSSLEVAGKFKKTDAEYKNI
jgi:hypothetical protein